MKKTLYVLLLMPTIALATEASTYGSAEISQVTSIYDGDTFRVNIDGWPEVVGKNISIRVNGIDTPELRGACFEEKTNARFALRHTEEFIVLAERLELRNIRRGKYFRLIADVYDEKGRSLAESLISEGLARPYSGGTREGWCHE